LSALSHGRLARLIKPAGYFNVKTKRIKNFLDYFLGFYKGDIACMKRRGTSQLRDELLAVNGIGPETADSILLYALDKPVFVVDAYTKRFLARHAVIDERAGYQDIQSLFMKHLPRDILFFNEYHALIVRLGKEYCRPKPRCESCPLNGVHSPKK
jgi:endonuclease-3 related protein